MRIAIASSSSVALPTLQRIATSGHDLVGIITRPDAPQGRGRELAPSEIASAVSDQTIFKPSSEAELEIAINALAPDLVVAIAYGRLIRAKALSLPRFGWINLHFSKLPQYRGAAPVQRALLDGVEETGCTVFQLDAGMDTGPIYRIRNVDLQGSETTGELLRTLSEIGASEVMAAIEMISAGIPPTPQFGTASLAPKIGKEETRISWEKSAVAIERQVRAFQPSPGAWTSFREQRIAIVQARVESGDGAPGVIVQSDPLTVATGRGHLVITKLQSQGRRELLSQDWVRGARILSGDRFV